MILNVRKMLIGFFFNEEGILRVYKIKLNYLEYWKRNNIEINVMF